MSLPSLEKGKYYTDKKLLNSVELSIRDDGKTTKLDLNRDSAHIESFDYNGQTLLFGVFEASFKTKVKGLDKDQVFFEDRTVNVTVNITALPESGLVHVVFVGNAPSTVGLGYLAFGNLDPTPELVQALRPR